MALRSILSLIVRLFFKSCQNSSAAFTHWLAPLALPTILVYISGAHAVDLPLTITYQGRLYDSSSSPIENTVDLKLDIYSQDGSCLLYSESKQLDLSSSSGFFSTQIGSVTGSSSRTSGVDPGLSMQAVFDNSATKTGASSCTYTPSARDGRKIQVTIVKIGSSTVNTVLSPKQSISSVPYATVAQTLQGKGPESFVQLTGSITQSDFEGLMAKKSELLNLAAQETALLALAGGTSTTYLKSGSSISNAGDISLGSGKSLQLGTFSTAQETTLVAGFSSADVGKTWYNSDTNKLMYFDGTSAKAIGSGSSQISSVSAGAPLSVANGATAPVLSLDYGSGLTTSSNQLVPDFGTASGKVAQGDDSRFNPTLSGAGDAGKIVQVNSGGTAYQFVSTSLFNIDSTNSRIGIGTSSPSNDLSLGGSSARVIAMERHSAANTAGSDLSLGAGGAATGATDRDGGKLILSSGTSTGSGSSSIELKTATSASTGTGDNAPSTKMTITGAGNVGIGTSSPVGLLHLSDDTGNNRFLYVSSQSSAQPFHQSGIRLRRARGTEALPEAVQNGDAIGGYQFFAHDGTDYIATGTIGAIVDGIVGVGDVPSATVFYTRSAGASAHTEKMRISSGGNIGIGVTAPTVSLDISGKTDAIRLPAGTTAERPNGANGLLRYNSDNNTIEAYVDGSWTAVATAAMAMDLSGNQSVAGNKSFSGAATFSATGPSAALDVTGSGGMQTTLLNVTGASTMAGNLNVSSGKFFVDATNTRIGIGTSSPSYDFSLGGAAARTIAMERHATANTAGNNMTLAAGGATSGATDKNGGDLYLKGGTSTGAGTSNIYLQTASAGSTGTADNAPSTKVTILGDGNVGIGNANPTVKLDVSGNGSFSGALSVGSSIKVANDSSTCTSTNAGSIRWNGSAFQGCDGSSWSNLASASGTTPTNFSFTDQAAQEYNTTVCSNVVTLSGLNVPVFASVPPGNSGSPYLKINGTGSAGSTYGTVQSGTTLQTCATTANANLTSYAIPVTVGAYTNTWNITTGNKQSNPFSFSNPASPASVSMTVDQCASANITGLTISSPVTVTTDLGSVTALNINGAGWSAYTGSQTISNNQSLCVRITTNNNPSDAHHVTVKIGNGLTGVTAQTATYTVTNPAQDTTPDSYSFVGQIVPVSTLTNSASVTISGITGNVPVSVSGSGSPQISVAGGSWTTSTTIQNNQSLQVRLTSSSSSGTNYTATVQVGTGSATWSVTSTGTCTYSGSSQTTYATAGNFTFTVPSGTTCIAYAIWGGGSGAGAGWGAGGGGFVSGTMAVSTGQQVPLVVGAGGVGGGGGACSFRTVTAGGTSSIASVATATGGSGSNGGSYTGGTCGSAGGAGGRGCSIDDSANGGNGGSPSLSCTVAGQSYGGGGGGGGSGSRNGYSPGIGGNANSSSGGAAGSGGGGTNPGGGAGGGAGCYGAGAGGGGGAGPGGGGAGAGVSSPGADGGCGTSSCGGDGGAGRIIIYY